MAEAVMSSIEVLMASFGIIILDGVDLMTVLSGYTDSLEILCGFATWEPAAI